MPLNDAWKKKKIQCKYTWKETRPGHTNPFTDRLFVIRPLCLIRMHKVPFGIAWFSNGTLVSWVKILFVHSTPTSSAFGKHIIPFVFCLSRLKQTRTALHWALTQKGTLCVWTGCEWLRSAWEWAALWYRNEAPVALYCCSLSLWLKRFEQFWQLEMTCPHRGRIEVLQCVFLLCVYGDERVYVLFIWLDLTPLHCTLQQHMLSSFVLFPERNSASLEQTRLLLLLLSRWCNHSC